MAPQEAGAPAPDPAGDQRRRLIAILLIISAGAIFSMLDATAKWLSPRIGVLETTWIRYLVSSLFVLALVNPISKPGFARTRRPGLQWARSFVLFGSTAFNFFALQYLQLTQTMTIMFLQPLVVALVAGPLLGEWVGPRRLAAIAVGFVGVLLVTRPGAGGIHWAAIFSFVAAGASATYSLLTRMLAAHDPPETTMFYSGLAGIVMLTPVMPFIWHAQPDGLTMLLMLLVGFFGAFGHWLLILAHRLAPAGVLAPFAYTQIIWMSALGFLVFGDVPDGWTIAGGAIVVGSGIYLIHRERVRRVNRD